jgi:hypothetical protein
VITESGPVEIAVPRDRAGSFEPQPGKKRQRCLGGVDEMVLSLSTKGLKSSRPDDYSTPAVTSVFALCRVAAWASASSPLVIE